MSGAIWIDERLKDDLVGFNDLGLFAAHMTWRYAVSNDCSEQRAADLKKLLSRKNIIGN